LTLTPPVPLTPPVLTPPVLALDSDPTGYHGLQK
jgi:hypothetical protein